MNEAVEIQVADEAASLPESHGLRYWAEQALAAVGRGASGVTVRIVTADESRALNRGFRGCDYATNVLSFPFDAEADFVDEGEPPYCGDLAICAEVVEREATDQGKSLDAHWAHMIVHGVAHLAGYDHQDDAEAGRMEALERTIMSRLGFADPYATAMDSTEVDDG